MQLEGHDKMNKTQQMPVEANDHVEHHNKVKYNGCVVSTIRT